MTYEEDFMLGFLPIKRGIKESGNITPFRNCIFKMVNGARGMRKEGQRLRSATAQSSTGSF